MDILEIADKWEQIINLEASALAAKRDLLALLRRPAGVTLDVPYLSQLGPDAAFAPGDCGTAVLAMWLNYLGKAVTVDEVSAQTRLDRGFNYTMPAHLIWAARHWGVDLYWQRNLTLDVLRAEIDAGQPCIILVNYPSLPSRMRYDPNYKDGHWLLVVGYDTMTFKIHDPYHSTEIGGAFVSLTIAELDKSWALNHLNGNSDRQMLRVRR